MGDPVAAPVECLALTAPSNASSTNKELPVAACHRTPCNTTYGANSTRAMIQTMNGPSTYADFSSQPRPVSESYSSGVTNVGDLCSAPCACTKKRHLVTNSRGNTFYQSQLDDILVSWHLRTLMMEAKHS